MSARERMLQISVNIIGEHAELDDELAEPYKQEFTDIQDVLEASGLPRFQEPEQVIAWGDDDNARQYDERMSAQCLHALRGAYAAMKAAQEQGYPEHSFLVPAFAAVPAETWTALADSRAAKGGSHLCTHSITAGVYLPLEELQQPLLAYQTCPWRPIPGGIIGSSIKLLDELIELAPYIGIELDEDETLGADEHKRVYNIAHAQGEPMEHVFKAWLALHETAELSLAHGTAIYLSS